MTKYLLVDIGNSAVSTATFDGIDIRPLDRRPTSAFEEDLSTLQLSRYRQVIVSSVVPSLDPLLNDLPNVRLMTAENIPISGINMTHVASVGSDRLLNALAAYNCEKRACLIVDSGTALTFCVVDDNGVYQGGSIFPGMKISSKALNLYTAKIPLITVKPRDSLLGKTTREAVENGLYFGYIRLINGLIEAYKASHGPLLVLGTGYGLDVIKRDLYLDKYDELLIFKGLKVCIDDT